MMPEIIPNPRTEANINHIFLKIDIADLGCIFPKLLLSFFGAEEALEETDGGKINQA